MLNNSRGAVSNHHNSNNINHQRINQNQHHQHHGSLPNNANANIRASQNVPNRAPGTGAQPGVNQQRTSTNSNHHGHHPNKPQQNHVNPQQRTTSGNMQQQPRPPSQMNRPNQSQGNSNQSQQQQQAAPQQPPMPNVLPKGFKREEEVRTKGISAGIVDIVYTATTPPVANSNDESTAPTKQKFRSKLELHKKIGDKYDMALLDYRTGKISQMVWRKQRRMKSLASTTNTNYASAAKYDVYLNLPIRQTSSVFKQTVSYVTNNHKNEAPPEHVVTQKTDRSKPVQLFWELRFDNLKAIDTQYENDCDLNTDFELDNKIKFNNFPLSNENILRSVAASWYLNQNKILIGQDIKEFTKNPRVFIDRDQPIIPAMSIKEDEIQQQEAKVKELRKQMEITLNELKKLDDSILNVVDLKCEKTVNTEQAIQMDVGLNEDKVDGIKVEQD